MAFKHELTSKHYSLHDRLRLFEAVVTPTVLYGSTSWSLTLGGEKLLMTAQRRILRMILGSSRRRAETNNMSESFTTMSGTDVDSDCEFGQESVPADPQCEQDNLEPWVEWVKRSTREVETHFEKLHIECWVHQVRRKRWQWARRVAGLSDDRWTKIAANWVPSLHFDGRASKAARQQGRPKQRWEDDLNDFLKKVHGNERSWASAAQNSKYWLALENQFVKGDWREPCLSNAA